MPYCYVLNILGGTRILRGHISAWLMQIMLIYIVKRTTEALLEVSREVQVLNEEKTKYRLHSCVIKIQERLIIK
jgi:hypothetical protein